MDFNFRLWDEWLEYATEGDFRSVIQTAEYTRDVYLFLQDLQYRLEQYELYEFCQIIQDELIYRDKILNDFYGFEEE